MPASLASTQLESEPDRLGNPRRVCQLGRCSSFWPSEGASKLANDAHPIVYRLQRRRPSILRDFLETSAVVDKVIQSRKTTRAFRTDEVPNAVVNEMLAIASSAPSTFTTQPWQVHVLTGKPKNALSEALLHAHLGNTQAPYAAITNPYLPIAPHVRRNSAVVTTPCWASIESHGRSFTPDGPQLCLL